MRCANVFEKLTGLVYLSDYVLLSFPCSGISFSAFTWHHDDL